MRLPVPVRIKDVMYTDCEITAPTVNVIAETRRIVDNGNFFASMRPFCAGVIKEFKTSDGTAITDPIAIKSIIPRMPYRSVEFVSLQAILKHYSDDDGIEGVYYCPRCNAEVIAEIIESDGTSIDTRDHIGELAINYFEGDAEGLTIHVQLTEPVLIIDKKDNETLIEVNNLAVGVPTLEQCITAEGKVGNRDSVKLQLAIYVEALEKVNGEAVDNKYRTSFGMYIFGNIRAVKKDLGYLADQINQYGLDRTVQKECRKCGKIWKAFVNTSNFFVSAPLSF